MIESDAALILFLVALSLCLTAGGTLADLGNPSPPSRLTFLMFTGALICGLLVLILIAPVVFLG